MYRNCCCTQVNVLQSTSTELLHTHDGDSSSMMKNAKNVKKTQYDK